MPSFDVVSELNEHEFNNALDQANREVANRYDFKGTDAKYTYQNKSVQLEAESEFQVQQMLDLLYQKMAKRSIELGYFKPGEIEIRGKRALQTISVKQGIDKDLARTLLKRIKDSKLKVQAAIQGEQVRVTGKKRDDLQEVIALLKQSNFATPLQFSNFRD